MEGFSVSEAELAASAGIFLRELLHIDGVMRDVSIIADGVKIAENAVYLAPELSRLAGLMRRSVQASGFSGDR